MALDVSPFHCCIQLFQLLCSHYTAIFLLNLQGYDRKMVLSSSLRSKKLLCSCCFLKQNFKLKDHENKYLKVTTIFNVCGFVCFFFFYDHRLYLAEISTNQSLPQPAIHLPPPCPPAVTHFVMGSSPMPECNFLKKWVAA